jgi:hypothetical protein
MMLVAGVLVTGMLVHNTCANNVHNVTNAKYPMNQLKEAQAFINTQKSLQFYTQARESFVRVLSHIPEHDFLFVKKNLIIMALHEGAVAQVMHFPQTTEKFRVLQITIPTNIPDDALDWVIAHELGHVMQDRNWQEEDGDTLETDASRRAKEWGFEKTPPIDEWLAAYRTQFGVS